MRKIHIKVHLEEGAKRPEYATVGSSGLDLYPLKEGVIKPGKRATISTGVYVELERGTEGTIRPRSGNSSKGIDVAYGTIDWDYRGELKVTIINNSDSEFKYSQDKAIAQLVVSDVVKVSYSIADKEMFTITERGEGGFGHTDKPQSNDITNSKQIDSKK